MAFRDLLLNIDSYPAPTSSAGIDEAIRLALSFGAKLTALAVEVDMPVHTNRLADYLIDLSAMAEAEEAKSRVACHHGLTYFSDRAKEAGVFAEAILARRQHEFVPDHVAGVARTYDLCILPYLAPSIGAFGWQSGVAKTVMFDSGRPVLIFRSENVTGLIDGPAIVVVAWDGSRSASRALADSLPVLKRAREVRLLTVLNEKPGTGRDHGEAAQRHLRMHGVEAVLDEVDAAGKPIGTVLDHYVKSRSADLLVMGAYGHSRAREFLLGGATEHTLNSPVCPVFLSH